MDEVELIDGSHKHIISTTCHMSPDIFLATSVIHVTFVLGFTLVMSVIVTPNKIIAAAQQWSGPGNFRQGITGKLIKSICLFVKLSGS